MKRRVSLLPGSVDRRHRLPQRALAAVALLLLAQEQRRYPGLFVQGLLGTRISRSPRRQLLASSAPESAAAVPTDRSQLKRGQEFDGQVIRLSNHGAVVRLDGTPLFGFVHVSEMKDKFVEHPSELVSVGQKVSVRVLKAEADFLGLTMKNLGRKIISDFAVGQEVQGRVRVVKPFGAWVDIGWEKEALLHKTQIKEGVFVPDATRYLGVGDKITVRIRGKDEDKEQIELSMRAESEVLSPLQRNLKIAELQEGQELGGVVTSVRDFGCFVDVGAESDGLIHIRNINDGLISNIDDVVGHGDNLLAKVIGTRDGKLELALISPLPRLPAVDAFASVPADEWLEGEIVGMVRFGIFVEVVPPGDGPKVTAFLGYKESKDRDFMRYGDMIKVRVLKVDVENKQLFVTMRSEADDASEQQTPAAGPSGLPEEGKSG